MKKLLFICAILTVFIACDSNDDGFYNRIYLRAQNQLVFIEPDDTYTVGENLLVQANIPKILAVNNQATGIDLKRTSNADSFNFSFVLERKNGATWELVDVSNQVVVTAPASAVGGYFVQATAPFSEVNNAYAFTGGITLNQVGEYRLSFTYNNSLTDTIELFSNSPGNNIQVSIQSPSNQLNAEGFYLFTVQ